MYERVKKSNYRKAKERPCQVRLCQAIRKPVEADLRLASSSQS